MERIDKEIIVNASLEKIFSYIEDPNNWSEFWINLNKVSNVQRTSAGGYKAKYEYTIAGMRFKGEGEYTDYVRNNWIVLAMKGGIIRSMAFTFRAIYEERFEYRTRVTFTVDYEIKIPVIKKISEILIRNMITREIELIMMNLAARFIVDYRARDSVIRN
ncbi:SRPBCC family protein [Chloroflexota bacterium]